MGQLSKQTATDIALAWREIEAAELLLADVEKATASFGCQDIRDAFGRPQRGLELGVPTSDTARRLFNVPYPLAKVVIQAHIADRRAVLAALNEKARMELADAR